MIIEVKRAENESTINLLRRFTKKIKETGILDLARNLRFRNRPKSDHVKKKEALKKIKIKKRLEYLKKLGKIK